MGRNHTDQARGLLASPLIPAGGWQEAFPASVSSAGTEGPCVT